MVSHLLYYQLALFALVWLFIMAHLTWPQPGVTAPAVSRMVKKLETSLTTEFTTLPSPTLRLA